MKSFSQVRESVTSADKKPEKYVDPEGKTKVRMVPVDKNLVKEQDQECPHCDMEDGEHEENCPMMQEKTLTPAEKKKREEIAKAMERENPGMDMSKKMAIATAAAKRVAEEKQLDEISSNKLGDYMRASSADAGKPGASARRQDKRIAGQSMADKKIRKKMGYSSTAKVAAEATDADYHKTLGPTKNSDEGIAALKKKHGMSHAKAVATLKRLMGESVEEAVGTSAKYAGKSGMFGGKYTSKDRMMDMPLDKLNKIRDKRSKQKHDAHMAQDPKMAKMGYAKHMLDTDKADAKAKKRGIDPTGKYDKYAKRNNIRNEDTQLDEVLDTPKAMQSYKDKAKYSSDRAANSAAAKMLRNPKGFHSTDTSDELKTMDKRAKGLKMADKNAMKKTFKALRGMK